ncbi:MAG: 5'-nucleotidase, lipoprotein e(P4) family [Bacteroidales bacterium]
MVSPENQGKRVNLLKRKTALMTRYAIILLSLTVTYSCTSNNKGEVVTESSGYANKELVMATLYNYYSAEFMAASFQAFNIASERITSIAGQKPTSKLAVVVDIDETILDNSPYQARTIETGQGYPAEWDEWCNLAAARPVPGSVEFLKLADSLGYSIFYISNRKEESVLEGTYKNLTELGFPQVDERHLMLRMKQSADNPAPSDKESRRKKVESMGYEIVLLAGDNLGDFFTDAQSGNQRTDQVMELYKEFGNRFIVLPNAMYGNWPSSINIDGSEEVYDSLLFVMTEPFREKGD